MKGLFTILLVLLTATAAIADAGSEAAPSNESIEKLRRIKAQVQLSESGEDIGAPSAEEPKEQILSQPTAEETSQVGKAFQGLALCLGVFFVLIYFLKRTRPQSATGGEARLQLRERLSVGPKANVALLSIDGREVLVGVSENHVSLLQEISPKKIRRPIPLTKAEVVPCINE